MSGPPRALTALVALAAVAAAGCGAVGDARRAEPLAPPRAAEAFADLPVHFEPVGDGEGFVARAGDSAMLLTADSAMLSLGGAGSATVRLGFVGAGSAPTVQPVEPLPGISNYVQGADPSAWRLAVPHFGGVRYEGVYPGVDLLFYGSGKDFEYDFVVAPGADPSTIRLSIDGGDPPRLDSDGSLVVTVAGGELLQRPPKLYQEVDGQQRPVPGRFTLAGPRVVGFEVGAYDTSLPLVIDPVIAYSTYLGGSSGDQGGGIAVDAAGNAYVVGATNSADFPVLNSNQPFRGSIGSTDAFVTKLSPSGALLYSTYLGGSQLDIAEGVAVDGSGNAYVTGLTNSTDFPVLNPFQASQRGSGDAFVTKLNPSGSLAYSTYLGGSQMDSVQDVAVDGSGSAYVAGYTYAEDFPTANAVQAANAGGFGDLFVTKLSPSGSTLAYSTYFGGTNHDWGYGIGVSSTGIAVVTGGTMSSDYPIKNALQPALQGTGTAFATSFDAAGGLRYSTYLGGSGAMGFGAAVDGAGDAYITGETGSATFPVLNAFQPTRRGSRDAFVAKVTSAGALAYATYLGGSDVEVGQDVTVDGSGQAHVVGVTLSNDFPIVDPVQPALRGSTDFFVARLTAGGNALSFSTYLGGTGPNDDHWASGVGVDPAGSVVVSGSTAVNDFPVVNALQPTHAGGQDAFVTKIAFAGSGTTTPTSFSGEPGGEITVGASGLAPGDSYVLALGTSAANCRSGTRLGGAVVAAANGAIAPTVRTIPTTATSGTRYLCWVNADDSSVSSEPVAITVF